MCKYETETNELTTLMESVVKTAKTAKKRYIELSEELRLLDLEIQDHLHRIELTDFNACEGWSIAKEMQTVLQKRRKVKQLMWHYNSVKAFFDDEDVKNKVYTANGAIKETKNNIRTAYYTPKVRTDLLEKINSKCIKNVPLNLIRKCRVKQQ